MRLTWINCLPVCMGPICPKVFTNCLCLWGVLVTMAAEQQGNLEGFMEKWKENILKPAKKQKKHWQIAALVESAQRVKRGLKVEHSSCWVCVARNDETRWANCLKIQQSFNAKSSGVCGGWRQCLMTLLLRGKDLMLLCVESLWS